MSRAQFVPGRFAIAGKSMDRDAFRAELQDVSCGAFVLFEGWVRDHNDGREVLQLEYEVYEPLAIKEGQQILLEALERFDISQASAVHRHGLLALTEPAVLVGVASAHRGAAFDACRYIIDEVKTRLPIWKREHYADGTTEWVDCRKKPGVTG
jgi:molybdopterin synthase catalytic subunit